MASSETPPPSLQQGARIVPPDHNVTVEEVLSSVGEQVGHDQLSYTSRMNKAVVVFLTEEPLVHRLIESGVFIRDVLVQVSPLSAPSTRITVSGVPPFIHNDLLELASNFKSNSNSIGFVECDQILFLDRVKFHLALLEHDFSR
ncbi:hypothetical protein F2P81_001368 [Scophthalmus maximus]|uniref:Uncharacterized protein n=1 Tax=Scophthalmus maximus TaxID=52904 RepID=A0A6A4TR35_SCOMX|nr:hypothetical protein F2P81_001368 [Scophthalmus maximus]